MKSHFLPAMLTPVLFGIAGCTTSPEPERDKVGLANPASTFCTRQGGTVEMRQGSDGTTGYCHLPDGTVVEEWEYYRAHQAGGAGADNSRNALDWAGTYRGVLPCADCEGIETTVTLRADGSYTSASRYLGKSAQSFTDEGRFEWNAAGGVISLSGDEPARYRVGENRLIRLALDGSAITGSLADHYILAKVMDGITGRQWKLIELNGQPVPKLDQTPHLMLDAAEKRATGYGGCNNFTGSYTLDEGASRISFGQVASTMRACTTGMDVEQAFHDALSRADNYSLNGNTMTLNRARMAPLARFEAVTAP